MKTITKTINVYSFEELPEESKNKAIGDTIQYFLESFEYRHLSKNMQKAIDHAERMQTPWFTNSYILDYAKDEILEFCKQYEYLESGDIFLG